jgi:competence protein ComEC
MSVIAILGSVYFQFRVPVPDTNDISNILPGNHSKTIIVEGDVLNESRINTSGKVRFWFRALSVKSDSSQSQEKKLKTVTGKLYVTLPISEGKMFYPRQHLTLEGVLYKPSAPASPSAFDFKAYLARYDTFAGLKGLRLIQSHQPPWGFWKLRHRIIKAQNRWLGTATGSLLSSIVLGSKAVDLPHDIQTIFIKAGLAHVLAASGFHVALLLGIVLFLTRNLSKQKKLIIGFLLLGIYLILTGLQPSIMRAALMGVGVLIGVAMDRKVNSLGSLLIVATILLIFQPLWIWDLGFQLSFLATLGLIVTLPILLQKLDWLPPTIATIIAVPVAASLWTYPLLMHIFSVIATYGIICNIIVSPLVMLISIGGMISATLGLIFPLAGSAIAWLLYYPTNFLIAIATFFTHLPGSSYAVGSLPIGLMWLIYGLFIAVWLSSWLQNHWRLVSLIVILLVVVPVIATRLRLVQVTVLAADSQPVMIIQNQGKVTLINSGGANDVKYQLIPFLSQQGINQINCAIAFSEQPKKDDSAWSELKVSVPIKKLNTWEQVVAGLSICEDINPIKILSPNSLLFTLKEQQWLWVRQAKTPPSNPVNISPQVVLWSGTWIHLRWLDQIKPQVAIAVARSVSQKTRKYLEKQPTQLYWTGRDGAIQWTPKSGIQSIVNQDISD